MAKYAYSTMSYLSLPPLKAVKHVIGLGLPVELSYDNFVVFGGINAEHIFIEELIREASNLSGYVKAIHIPYDWMEPGIAMSEVGFRRYVKWLGLAHRLGAEVAVIHTLRISEDYKEALELNIEFLRSLSREASDRGVVLAVENRLESNLFGSKPRDIAGIVDGVGDAVGVCLDIGHANINKNLREFLTLLGRSIVAMHVHDNDGARDLHKPPYSGTVDWGFVENWMARTGFKGLLIFEINCSDSVSVCDSVINSVRLSPIANL